MSLPAVSVVIPVHNRSRLLAEALDSVARQTFQDFEVIVVDDGSTEDVESVVRAHSSRAAFIRQPNRGPGAARNRGIQSSSAEYVAFLDSDDLWLPTKLERYMSAIREADAPPILYGPMSPISADGAPMTGRTKPCVGGQVTQSLFCSSFVHVPTVLCRRELLRQSGGFDESLPVCEDYDLWLRISLDHPFGLIDEPLALRRLHGNRLSKSHMSRNLDVKAGMLKRFYATDRAAWVIAMPVAHRRLAKVCFAAGRAAFRNGQFRLAIDHLRESRRFGHAGLPILPWQCAASALSVISREASPRRAPLVQQ